MMVALILGWGADFLFYGQAWVGISFPIFITLLLVALAGLSWLEGLKSARQNLWLMAPLLFFAAMVFVRANLFLTVLNILASLLLLGLVAHFYAAGWVQKSGLIGYPIILVQTGISALYRAAPLLSNDSTMNTMRQQTRHSLLPILRGFLIAIPVLATFTCFLASADLVFASYIETFLALDFLDNIVEMVWRLILILMMAWFLAGALVYALTRQEAADADHPIERTIFQMGRHIPFGFIEGITLLTLVNLLFLAFVAIQFTYLFGGLANIQLDGYTYAQYARRGFFELVIVSVLTLTLILGLCWIMKRQNAQHERIFNSLSSLIIGLVLVMLVSAFQRLRLYEAAFGFTELRLYSHLFMIWLAVTLVWLLITLWWRRVRFAPGALAAGLGFLITLNLINPDAFIVRQNLSRYLNTGSFTIQGDTATTGRDYAQELDIYYFDNLSSDAVPALITAAEQVNESDKAVLQQRLNLRLDRLENRYMKAGWPAFHWSRQNAYRLLLANRTE